MEPNTEEQSEERKLEAIPEAKKQTFSTPMAIVAAGFLIMLGIIIAKTPTKIDTTAQANIATTTPTDIQVDPISPTDHVLGNPNTAQVTMIEFSDTECPYCKAFQSALEIAMAKYPGKLAWVYRHFPLDSIHPKTRYEARTTECVAAIGGNDAFWKYLDLIFATTPSNNGLDPKVLPELAQQVGIPLDKFNTCAASTQYDALVEADYEDGERAGATGTPYTILITQDGQKIPIMGDDEATLNADLSSLIK